MYYKNTDKFLNTLNNLESKLRYVEKTAGVALIHDVRSVLSTINFTIVLCEDSLKNKPVVSNGFIFDEVTKILRFSSESQRVLSQEEFEDRVGVAVKRAEEFLINLVK